MKRHFREFIEQTGSKNSKNSDRSQLDTYLKSLYTYVISNKAVQQSINFTKFIF